MRTHKEFMKQIKETHDCKECHGKIFSVSIDSIGNRRCGYCHKIVEYPKPTMEEIRNWMGDVLGS